jgi:hypothetical protein
MLVSVILFFAQVLTMTAWGESNIKKTPEGKAVLAKLSSAGLFFLRWRAFADYKKELEFLRKCFGWLSIVLVCAFTVFPDGAKQVLSVYSIAFMGLWMSIRMGTDVKGQLKEMLTMALLFFCAPFSFLAMDWFHLVPYSTLHAMAAPLRFLVSFQLNDLELAFVLGLLGGVAGIIMAISSVLIFSIVPLLLLFGMVVVSRISRNLLRWDQNKARNFVAVYVLVIGPALILLHSLQII